jgi:hypothetical protein
MKEESGIAPAWFVFALADPEFGTGKGEEE